LKSVHNETLSFKDIKILFTIKNSKETMTCVTYLDGAENSQY